MRTKAVGWSFVAMQVVLLGGLIALPGADDWRNPQAVSVAARWGAWVGLGVVVAASVILGRALTPTPVPKGQAGLRTSGLYRVTRHPIYSGVLLFTVCSAVASQNAWKLALSVVIVGFFNLKARWEEARLRETYPEYRAYAQHTPRFVPSARKYRGRSRR